MIDPKKLWKPLVSDPKILEEYSIALGVKSKISFVDIYSTEEAELNMYGLCPISILALVPINDGKIYKRSNELGNEAFTSQSVWFMKQYIPNSCGPVAILHSILNNNLELEEGSIAKTLLNIKGNSNELPKERGLYLVDNKRIEHLHERLSKDLLNESTKTDFHYITLVNINGNIIELDGRLPFPISHGKCGSNEFLMSSLKIIKEKFISPMGIDGKAAIIAVCLK